MSLKGRVVGKIPFVELASHGDICAKCYVGLLLDEVIPYIAESVREPTV